MRWRRSTRLRRSSNGISRTTLRRASEEADAGRETSGLTERDGSRRTMEVRRGIAVAPGVAIGPALVLGSEDFRIPQRFVRVDAVDTELARFRTAVAAAVTEIAGHEELA